MHRFNLLLLSLKKIFHERDLSLSATFIGCLQKSFCGSPGSLEGVTAGPGWGCTPADLGM